MAEGWRKSDKETERLSMMVATARKKAKADPADLISAEDKLDYHLSTAISIMSDMRETAAADRVNRIRGMVLGVKRL